MSDGDAERYARVSETLAGARGLRGASLAAYLDEACGDDEALREEVLDLLSLATDDDGTDAFSDQAMAGARRALDALVEGASSPWRPEKIGSYTIVRQIGQGGMGVVYEATQESPRRSVAIKLLHASHVAPERLRRFRQEAELLGRLQHPGIAQIIEASTFDAGHGPQPFFAMELVQGVPLTEYADDHDLDTAGRLELIAQLCDILQYAHQQGIVHRDLKPANILVSTAGSSSTQTATRSSLARPKILDFGVARALDTDFEAMTLQTTEGQLIGTIQYMSPEQASGDPAAVDARSDVYALGVLAYELLGRRLPHDFSGLLIHDAVRVLREEDPSSLGSIDRALRGDVETIVQKALEKDVERRYGSAAELSSDIRRYLHHVPIEARPPSALYQLRKFARRNKAIVGGVAATFLVLVAGIVVALLLMFRAERGEAAAERGNYVARITAASASIGDDPVAARQTLLAAPVELRNWEWDWLFARTEPVELVFTPPRGQPCDVAFRGDGTPLCLVRDGDELVVYDVARGSELSAFAIPARYTDVFLSRDGSRVGAEILDEKPIHSDGRISGESMLLHVHDADSGRIVDTCERPSWPDFARRLDPHAAQFFGEPRGHQLSMWLLSPDGGLLLWGSINNRFVELRDAASEQTLRSLLGHRAPIHSAAFTRDSARVITSCSGDSTVRVWDAATGALQRTVFVERPGRVAVSDDGSRVAVLSEGSVKLFGVDDAASRVIRLDNYVYSVAVDGERGLIAAGTHGRGVRMFDAWSGEELGRWEMGVGPMGLAFSPDGRRLAGGGHGDFVDVARMAHCCARDTAVEPVGVRCASSAEIARAYVRSGNLTIEPRSATAEAVRIPVDLPDGTALAIHPDSQRLAGAQADGGLAIYDLATRQQLATLRGHIGTVFSLAFLPDGSRLVSGGNDQTVRLWDTHSFEQVAMLRGHHNYVHGVAASRDGSLIVSGSGDRTVRVWDRRTRRDRIEQRTRDAVIWDRHRARVLRWFAELRDPAAVADRIGTATSVEPEHRAVLLRRTSELIAMAATGADLRQRSEAYLALVAAAAAVWEDDPTLAREYLERAPEELRGWEWHWLRQIEEIQPVESHYQREAADTDCVAFDRNGAPLYAFVDDGKVRVADVATQETVRVLEYGGGIARPSLSPDGARVVAWGLAGGAPRHLLEWDLATAELVTEVRDCAHAGGAIAVGRGRHVAWNHPGTEPDGHTVSLTILDLGGETAVQGASNAGTCAFTPDGNNVYSGFWLFDVRTGLRTKSFRGMAWDHVGRLRVGPGLLRLPLTDVASGDALGAFDGVGPIRRPLAFSPDSRWLAATLEADDRIAVWDVASREHRLTVAATSLAFAHDGSRVVVLNERGARVISLTGPTRAERRAAITEAKEEIGPIVDRLFAELSDDEAVAARIQAEPTLDATRRRAALELLFDHKLQSLVE